MFAAAAVAMLLAIASSAAAQGTAATELERFNARLATASPADVPALIADLPSSWPVVHSGERLEVSTAWISRALLEAKNDAAGWPARRDALAARITAMQHELAGLAAPPAAPDIDRSRQVAAEILAREEFRRNVSESAIEHLRRAITQWFLSLWERLGGNRLGTRRATTIIAWAAALTALAALTWWLVTRVLRVTDRSSLGLAPPVARRRSARAWARDAAAANDPREAVRCAYRAAVASLEEEGAWRADDTRTPREHLRLLPAGHRRRALFGDVARRFEEVWFGARTPTSDDTRLLLSRLEELGCLRAD